MERIKQALERARTERQSGAAAPRSPVRASSPPVSETQITYAQTRIIQVSPKTLGEKRVIAGRENDAIADAYKVLRTQVLQRLQAHNWNVLAITSPLAGAGKTLTAVNLAVSLAQAVNHSVLLVDLDLRRPTVHKYFGYKPEYGLNNYLFDDVPLPEILFNPGIERLVVLPSNQALYNSSETLSSPKMVQLVGELKTRYPSRLVLFDLPPLLASDDALAFSPYVDAVLLVIEEGKTRRDQITQAADLLKGTHFLGTVLNKSAEPSSAYY